MVGAIIVAHCSIGKELIGAVEYLIGKAEGIVSISIDDKSNSFEVRRAISGTIQQLDQGDGVLILTDLFGGSPSNIAFSFLNREKIDVITGVNLPMILTFLNSREGRNLTELAGIVRISGVRSIVLARDLMGTKGAFKKRLGGINR